MTTGLGYRSINELVDVEHGFVSREIYVSSEIYQEEQERVFARAWLFIGHESQVAKPGDYFVSRMGEESVILSRDRDNSIHVFLNSCRHRGMKVCRYDEGNTPVFTCPYHGWSYAGDGSLVGVPRYKDAYREELDKSQWGLVEVAQMENYKGSIWATWDSKAPTFLEYMGDYTYFLDGLLDHRSGREGGSIAVPGIQKWTLPCNWKFAAENFQGDMYHNTSHLSVELVGIGPGGPGQSRQGGGNRGRRGLTSGITSFPDLGHGGRGTPPAIEEGYPFPAFVNPSGPLDKPKIVQEYFEHLYEERKENVKGKRVTWVGGNVFPNTSFHAMFPRTFAVWHPGGSADRCEGWRWLFVDADAPKEVVDLARHHFIRYSGPAGLTEQDDMENWNYAHASSRGTIARRYPYNYTQGLGHAAPAADLAGAVVSDYTVSEENARTLYRKWAQMMKRET